MTIAVMAKTRERLNATPRGQALLKLVDEYASPIKMARELGVHEQHIRQWLWRGRISRHGALQIESVTDKTKEELRPDLTTEDWEGKKPSGPAAGHEPVARTADAKLLVKLAEQYGSVKAVCDAAYCTSGDYHTWKSRGRIPAIKLPTFLALQQQAPQ